MPPKPTPGLEGMVIDVEITDWPTRPVPLGAG